jgi:hypothetical protein
MGYSKQLNLNYHTCPDGNIIFEDGVVYTPSDMSQLKRLREMSANSHTRLLPKIHMLKKAFDVDIGIIMREN